MKLRLSQTAILGFENCDEMKRTGTRIVIDYGAYNLKDYTKHMAEMFLLLTNWKSNKGYNVVDFRTFYGTNKLEIDFDCDEATAKDQIGYFNYFDYKNHYSKEDEKDYLLLKVLRCESIPVFELYADDDDYNDFVIVVEKNL